MTSPTTSYLIDSSVLISYLRGNRAIMRRLDGLPNRFVSPTIVAELAFGAHRAPNSAVGLGRVEALVRTATVLNIDERIGYDFAAIKSTLASTNQLIPDNDIWIAVTAMAYDLTLVTRDAHFSRIAAYGLVVDQW